MIQIEQQVKLCKYQLLIFSRALFFTKLITKYLIIVALLKIKKKNRKIYIKINIRN